MSGILWIIVVGFIAGIIARLLSPGPNNPSGFILTTATLIAAIQVLQMVRERDGAAGRPLQDALDPEDQPALEAICQTLEGKTEKQKNPHPKGSLAYASWVCARLGGWTGYYGKPGPIVMIHGLQSLKAMLHGWRLRNDV